MVHIARFVILMAMLSSTASAQAIVDRVWPLVGAGGAGASSAEQASKLNTYPLVTGPDAAASKINTYVLVSEAIVASSKFNTYILGVPSQGGVIPRSPMTHW